jgi:AcrR family transcriptional regulator
MQLNLRIQMNESLYLRDPESTELGQRIILNSIELINELGFEGFTFKKLGEYMGTTEASIYRYFENKHRLLTYLVSWYWSWLEYRIIILTQNMNDSREQLNRVVELLSRKIKDDISTTYINEELLQNIVIADRKSVV